MKCILIAFFLAALQLAACSSTLTVAPGRLAVGADTLTVQALNKKIEGQHIVVCRRDGATFDAEVIAIRDDSCEFLAGDGVGTQVVATREIGRLESNNHLNGGFNGFLFGGAGGFLLGAGIGWLESNHGETAGEMAGLGIAAAASTGAVVGAIVGTVYGTVKGDGYSYDFASPGAIPDSSIARPKVGTLRE